MEDEAKWESILKLISKDQGKYNIVNPKSQQPRSRFQLNKGSGNVISQDFGGRYVMPGGQSIGANMSKTQDEKIALESAFARMQAFGGELSANYNGSHGNMGQQYGGINFTRKF